MIINKAALMTRLFRFFHRIWIYFARKSTFPHAWFALHPFHSSFTQRFFFFFSTCEWTMGEMGLSMVVFGIHEESNPTYGWWQWWRSRSRSPPHQRHKVITLLQRLLLSLLTVSFVWFWNDFLLFFCGAFLLAFSKSRTDLTPMNESKSICFNNEKKYIYFICLLIFTV